MIKITEEWLVAHRACQPGLDWFREQGENDLSKLIDRAIASADCDALYHANWCICRVFTPEQCVAYANFAADEAKRSANSRVNIDCAKRAAVDLSGDSSHSASRASTDPRYAAFASDESARAAAAADAFDAIADFYCPDHTSYRLAMIKILQYGKTLLKKKEK